MIYCYARKFSVGQLACLALVVLTLFGEGCGPPCTRLLQQETSPDGAHLAEATLFGDCGGATVGYYTDVLVGRYKGASLIQDDLVWRVRGKVPTKLRWMNATTLEIMHDPLERESEQLMVKKDSFQGVSIRYMHTPRVSK